MTSAHPSKLLTYLAIWLIQRHKLALTSVSWIPGVKLNSSLQHLDIGVVVPDKHVIYRFHPASVHESLDLLVALVALQRATWLRGLQRWFCHAMNKVSSSDEERVALASIYLCLSGLAEHNFALVASCLGWSCYIGFKCRWRLYIAPIIFFIQEIFLFSGLQIVLRNCFKFFRTNRSWCLVSVPIIFLCRINRLRCIQYIVCDILKFLSFLLQISPFINLILLYWHTFLDLRLFLLGRFNVSPLIGNTYVIEFL